MNQDEMIADARAQIAASINKWNSAQSRQIVLSYEIPIVFDTNPKRLGAIEFIGDRILALTLNPVLWSDLYNAGDRFQTITHEIAHVIDVLLRGTSDHGAIWKSIHRFLGGDSTAKAVAKHIVPRKFKKVVRWLVTDKTTDERIASLTPRKAEQQMKSAYVNHMYNFTKMYREVVRENGKLIAKYSQAT